jgi:hypothetical protein
MASDVEGVLFNGGRLAINPTDLSGAWPYGGTELGVASFVRAFPRFLSQSYEREQDNGIQHVAYLGERWRVGALLEQWNNDAAAAVFPNTRLATGDRILTSPGQALSAGQSPTSVKLLIAPFDEWEDGQALILYDAVPLIEETAELNFSFIRTFRLAMLFEAQPTGDAEKTHELGPVSKLAVNP